MKIAFYILASLLSVTAFQIPRAVAGAGSSESCKAVLDANGKYGMPLRNEIRKHREKLFASSLFSKVCADFSFLNELQKEKVAIRFFAEYSFVQTVCSESRYDKRSTQGGMFYQPMTYENRAGYEAPCNYQEKTPLAQVECVVALALDPVDSDNATVKQSRVRHSLANEIKIFPAKYQRMIRDGIEKEVPECSSRVKPEAGAAIEGDPAIKVPQTGK